MKLLTMLWYSLRSIVLRGPLASFNILMAEKTGDQSFGIQTRGMVLQLSAGAHHYQGASYKVLEKLFAELKAYNVPTSFFDIGCGMGRVLVVAADKGFKTCTGIDFNADLIDIAIRNLNASGLSNKANLQAITADATMFSYPKEAQLYFLFNPFDAAVLEKCLRKIAVCSDANNYFLYMNPLHLSVFEQLGFARMSTFKTGLYTEAILYCKT